MICDVCGHANADRLTFCQECGRRLKSREARVVAPTPPRGMPKVVPPQAEALAQPGSPVPAAPAGARGPSRTRPDSAPPEALAPVAPQPASKTKDPSEPAGPTRPAASPVGGAVCPTCGTANPPMYRFCVTCGVTLPRDAKAGAASEKPTPQVRDLVPAPPPVPGFSAQPAPIASASAQVTPVPIAPAPVVVPATPPRAQVAPVPVAPLSPIAPSPIAQAPSASLIAAASAVPAGARLEDRIVPAPVVDIAPVGAPQKPIVCPRCQGQCIPAARFCQFCGGALAGDARGAGAAPSPAAPNAAGARFEADDARAPATGREPLVMAAGGRLQGQARGRLVVIEADGSEGMTFTLQDRPLDLGRSEGDILVKEDPYVSPRHARLVPDGGRWLLRDLASTNGIYLRLKKPHLLLDADLLLLGQEVLQFQLVSEPEKGLGHANQHGTLLFGSPITSRSARLCQRTVEGIIRDVYYLHRDETVIGRETGDIVFTADPFLSRRHAMIRRALARKESPGRGASRWDFTLSDLDSSNGTFIAIRNEIALQHGDFVRVGQHLFRVDFA